MQHFVPTRQEIAIQERESKLKKEEKARKLMIEKFEAENPPMDDRAKQLALQDRLKLMKTMDMANQMIDQKYKPKGTAKSNSQFLLSNAVGFDSIRMLNKMDEDKKERQQRQHRIQEELKRDESFRKQNFSNFSVQDAGNTVGALSKNSSPPAISNKKEAVRNMEAFMSLNAAKSAEEEEEDREYEERKAKIDEYLSTMDPRRREFEEKKIKAYRL